MSFSAASSWLRAAFSSNLSQPIGSRRNYETSSKIKPAKQSGRACALGARGVSVLFVYARVVRWKRAVCYQRHSPAATSTLTLLVYLPGALLWRDARVRRSSDPVRVPGRSHGGGGGGGGGGRGGPEDPTWSWRGLFQQARGRFVNKKTKKKTLNLSHYKTQHLHNVSLVFSHLDYELAWLRANVEIEKMIKFAFCVCIFK